MENYIDLAIKYGGFTTLDKTYLKNTLSQWSDEDKLTFITPPPSVINAYFAEIYQKQSPKAATDYFFDLSSKLNLLTKEPSFVERKPFIRLNLTGRSFGFAYENEQEVAIVFSENKEQTEVTPTLLFEIAQIFPQYSVYLEDGKIKMAAISFDESQSQKLDIDSLLTEVYQLSDQVIKLTGVNQEELIDLASKKEGQKYYHSEKRVASIYIKR